MAGQRVIVVGAGIVGCCLAKELTDRGCAVTVVDAGEAGHGTSSASFAWVNSNGKEPRSYAELNLLGLQAHERWAPAEPQRTWFHRTGNIKVVDDAMSLSALEARVSRLHEFGYRAVLLDPHEVLRMEPGLRLDNAVGAALFPDEGWIDTGLMCTSVLQQAVEAGATFLPFHRVTELTEAGVRVMTGVGAARDLSADVVNLAAGNGIRPIVSAGGVDFPTLPISTELPGSDDAGSEHPTVGMICTTTAVAGGATHMVHADGISFRPAANGGLTLTDHPTASQWDTMDPDLWRVPQMLLERARRICPALEAASIDTVTLGHRVLPADGVTIADWVDSDHRVYAVATHSGVTLSAHLAEAVANEVVDGLRHDSLRNFGLGRFGAFTSM